LIFFIRSQLAGRTGAGCFAYITDTALTGFMREKMKKVLLMIAFSAVVFSCSKDEDPAPARDLKDVRLSLVASGSADPVELPVAMYSSTDVNVQTAIGYVAQFNDITQHLSYFTPPVNAEESNTIIVAPHGSPATSPTAYLAYTWSDVEYSIAYQLSQRTNRYVFEIFKEKGGMTWGLYLYAEENIDGTEGMMKVYNPLFSGAQVITTYTWKRTGDVLELVQPSTNNQGQEIKLAISINTKTKAGSITHTISGVKFYTSEWDAQGNGKWTNYGQDGSVFSTGTWTAG
jgi:hypothetical protein